MFLSATLDREWRAAFRQQLERDFTQETILARALRVDHVGRERVARVSPANGGSFTCASSACG
jgi:hypothetical protein